MARATTRRRVALALPDASRRLFDESVTQTLVVPFLMIMGQVLAQAPVEVAFAERDHAVQALTCYGEHKIFRQMRSDWGFAAEVSRFSRLQP